MNIYFSDISICLLIVYLLTFLLAFSSARNKLKAYFGFIIFILTGIAFYFDPIKAWIIKGNYTDLYRFFNDMDVFQQVGWGGQPNLFQTNYAIIPVTKTLVYLVSCTRIYGLLPAASCLIYYSVASKTIIESKKMFGISNKNAALVFFIILALTNYKIVITNIRMPFGMALFFLVLFFDCTKRIKIHYCLFGYICLCGIHMIFILFLALRLIALVANKYSRIVVGTLLSLSGTGLYWIYNWFNYYSGNILVQSILKKMDFYTSDSISSYSEPWILFLGWLKIFFVIHLLLYCYKKLDRKKLSEISLFFDFTFVFTSFCIGSFWSFHLFHRMTNFMVFLIAFWYNVSRSTDFSRSMKSVQYNKRQGKILLIDLSCAVVVVLHFFYFFASYQLRVLCF